MHNVSDPLQYGVLGANQCEITNIHNVSDPLKYGVLGANNVRLQTCIMLVIHCNMGYWGPINVRSLKLIWKMRQWWQCFFRF
jgi:hypothetical protein